MLIQNTRERFRGYQNLQREKFVQFYNPIEYLYQSDIL